MTQAAAQSPPQVLKQLIPGVLVGLSRDQQQPSLVLTRAARAATRARAGFKPVPAGTPLPTCPDDASPAASPGAGAILDRLLTDPDAGLIEEWATLAQDRGVRVADRSVTDLLEWWSRQPRRSEAVFAATGARGQWLASLNPEWRKPVAVTAVPAHADELWQTGTGAERAALLTTIRRHDPARALGLVRSTWADDGADDRRRFIDALLADASMLDEPFLESALDDRAKSVRRAAAAALITIQGSRLRARMTALARTIIKADKKKGALTSGVVITLARPAEYDQAWDRDGIEEQPSGGGGKRAWWTRQVLAGADLKVWTEVSGLPPERVLESLDQDDVTDALDAITRAAQLARSPEWAGPVARTVLALEPKKVLELTTLWPLLTQDDQEALVSRIIEAPKLTFYDVLAALAALPGPWSPALSTRILALFQKHATSKKPDAWLLAGPIDAMVRKLSPTAVDAMEQTLAAMFSAESSNTIQKTIDKLRLRAEMHKEFKA
ncbi:MAG TPA: DUF5691 domain-containing protein [Phycisphaerales bacterium]|nr:DUF5691 domain-containing protein [Phycisphaerales bacterium]